MLHDTNGKETEGKDDKYPEPAARWIRNTQYHTQRGEGGTSRRRKSKNKGQFDIEMRCVRVMIRCVCGGGMT